MKYLQFLLLFALSLVADSQAQDLVVNNGTRFSIKILYTQAQLARGKSRTKKVTLAPSKSTKLGDVATTRINDVRVMSKSLFARRPVIDIGTLHKTLNATRMSTVPVEIIFALDVTGKNIMPTFNTAHEGNPMLSKASK